MTTPGGYALLYRRENNSLEIDAVELDETGRARMVRAYYAQQRA
ncbi:MAG TPA: hypothetical protein VMF09_05615 [Solirubrobacteraceae bacterium]|nr:hypothetical protein [Solirubrobacteraceae bacterium]